MIVRHRYVCIRLVFVGLVVSVSALGEEVPIEDFFATPSISDVTVSPDGRYVAAKGANSVQVLEFDTLRTVGQIFRDVGYVRVSKYWWVGDDRIVLTTDLDVKRSDRTWPTSTFIASNADGQRLSSPYQLFRDGEQRLHVTVVDPLPEDRRFVLIERGEQPFPPHPGRLGPHLMRMDIYTRGDSARLRGRQPGPLDFGNLYADREGIARVAVGYVSSTPAVFYRSSVEAEWTSLAGIVGADPAVTFRPVGFVDDSRFYVLSNHTGDRVGLYLFEPDPPRLEMVREDDELDITNVEWNAAGTGIAGLILEGQRPKYAIVDGESLRVQALRRLAGAFRGEWSRIVSQSRDGNRMVVNVFSDRNPGVWYLVELDSNKVRSLMAARPGIAAARMAGTESLSIKSRDGLMLHGYLTQGDAGDGQPKPLIVLPHAGPHGMRDGWAFDPVVQFFANRGFAVLRVNYRGSSGYGLEFERAGYREWGRGIVHDIVDATRAAAEQATGDADRICIVGRHYGAFAALAAVAQEPDLYNCAVGHAGIYDLGLIWGRGSVPRHLGDENTLRRWIGRNAEEHSAQSPVHNADRIKVPVFLSHGGIDERAPLAHTNGMVSALRDEGATVTTMIEARKSVSVSEAPGFRRGLLANADAFHQDEDKVRLYAAILAFIREHTSGERS